MGEEPSTRELEAVLGHRFGNPALLLCALTHRSLARQVAQRSAENGSAADAVIPGGDNERLEFLGDAVLNLVVAEALFHSHPEWQEGELTRVRALLVSRRHMEQVAGKIGLGAYLRLSKGEERSGLRHKSSVLSDSMEAVIGALFLDGGLEAVKAFVRGRVIGDAVEQFAEQMRSGAALGNYKSALQERLQAARSGIPVYRLRNESGPPHRRKFTVEVAVESPESGALDPLAEGSGSTKKRAEQDAARRALEGLLAGGDSPGANLPAPLALELEDGKSAAE